MHTLVLPCETTESTSLSIGSIVTIVSARHYFIRCKKMEHKVMHIELKPDTSFLIIPLEIAILEVFNP